MHFERWPWVEGSHAMRLQLLGTLNDGDLAFSPGGQAMPLGALCREMGEIQYSYIQSFKTFTQDFDYRTEEIGIEGSVERLTTWYTALDADMKATLESFSAEDVKKTIARQGGFDVPCDVQMEIYLQALLIFFGKMTIYLRVMDKPLTKDVADWIG